ncbi:hypothetical protein [Microtetraspora niveoalba]|uniref:hypothetical protein n=1 Tax=Microtetraspora niveoalba TaxID=46175 RepID=UPI00082A62DB|nr:hypothetical protein [Microtetraspora niveoalba]
MSGRFESVIINKTAVTGGLSQWTTMAGDLERDYPGLVARITELNAAEPWGGGSEGSSFRNSYYLSGGPEALIAKGKSLVKQIVEAGPRLRTTFDTTLAVDEAHAQDLAHVTAEDEGGQYADPRTLRVTAPNAAQNAGRNTAQNDTAQDDTAQDTVRQV